MKKNCFTQICGLYLWVTLLSLSFSVRDLYGQQEERVVSGIESISYSLPGSLEIVQGEKESLLIKGDADDIQKVITEMEGGKLKIYSKSHESGLSNISIFVTVVKLEELSVAGSGDATIKDVLNVNELKLSLSGSGNIKCNQLEAHESEINLAGSGDIKIGGKVHEVDINVAGSGDVYADGLESEEAEVKIAGSGSVKVWATKELQSNIVGSGDVSYKGRPLVDAKTSGSGSTKPL
jgi:hypothetical protein